MVGRPVEDLAAPRPGRKPWTQRMYDLAAEGKYDREFIIWEMLLQVPVGRGARQTMSARRVQAEARGHQTHEQGTHAKHATKLHRPGQRMIAARCFVEARKAGRIVVGDDGIVRLRGM